MVSPTCYRDDYLSPTRVDYDSTTSTDASPTVTSASFMSGIYYSSDSTSTITYTTLIIIIIELVEYQKKT